MANKKAYKPIEKTDFGKKVSGPVEWMDDRMGLGASNKLMPLRKVFPDHWSFMLGEIALWSFIVLLLSGTFLTLWFQPSMAEVVYDGSYDPLRGLEMSKAFASTLDISFEIRGGLLMRQVHHWAAMLFVAAIVVHLLRIFFTGAYRKPREVNWLIGLGLFQFALIEGFAGYSLPDDLLSRHLRVLTSSSSPPARGAGSPPRHRAVAHPRLPPRSLTLSAAHISKMCGTITGRVPRDREKYFFKTLRTSSSTSSRSARDSGVISRSLSSTADLASSRTSGPSFSPSTPRVISSGPWVISPVC
jgi:hypothetical protein